MTAAWQAQRPSSGQRQPPGIGDPHPDNLDRPLASMHGLGRCGRQPVVRLLAGSPLGVTEAIMLAHGFTTEMLTVLVLAPGADRALPPWRGTSATQSRRLLAPVRPGVSTDDAAPVADHAQAERWHWHVIWPTVRAQDRPVVAQPAAHVERPHAVGAHVAEGHWRSRQPPWPLPAKAAVIADMVWRRQLTRTGQRRVRSKVRPSCSEPLFPVLRNRVPFGACFLGYFNAVPTDASAIEPGFTPYTFERVLCVASNGGANGHTCIFTKLKC
jgi:hypothetical protein